MALSNNNQTFSATARVTTKTVAILLNYINDQWIIPTSQNFVLSWAIERLAEIILDVHPEFNVTDQEQAVNLVEKNFGRLQKGNVKVRLNACKLTAKAPKLLGITEEL
jgi:hypothetical protein